MTNNDKKVAKYCNSFICTLCDYNTCNRYNYNKHLATEKHKMLTNDDINDDNVVAKNATSFICKCGKEYKYRQGLSVHKKKCQHANSHDVEKTEPSANDLIMALLNDNKEMKKIIMELIPKVGNTTNTSTNTNSHNNIKQKFDINVFLNEKCKDAISINDFIQQIEIGIKDLLFTKEKGLAEGLSNIFIENMNKLSLYERPMHCTDVKRETLYIKQDNWTKDSDKNIIKDAVNKLACKQTKSLQKWKDDNPDFLSVDKKKDDFIKIVQNVTSDVQTKQDKIIRYLCKDIHINATDESTNQ